MSRVSSLGSTSAEAVSFTAGGAFRFSDLLAVTWARRALIQWVAIGTVALAAFVVFLLPTLYSTSAVVMLDQRKNNVTDLSAVLSALPTDPASLQNQIQILTSRDLALQVIGKLKLYEDPEFNPALRTGPLDDLVKMLDPHTWGGMPGGSERAYYERDAIVSAFVKRLSVSALGLSTTITVSFSARNPDKAALITNTIADTYVEDQVNAKLDATRKTTDWLNDRIHQLSGQLQVQEAAVQQYKADNNLADPAEGNSVVDQQLAAINAQLVQARADLAEKEANNDRVTAMVNSGNTADVSQVVSSPLIIQLRTQEADLLRQSADLSTRYGPRHPKLIALQTQQHDLEDKIAQEVSRIAGSAANDVAVARAQVSSLQASLGQVEKDASGQNMSRVELKALELNAASTRTMYEAFVGRLREAQDQDGMQNSDAQVISRAPIPIAPSSPHRTLILAASVPAGFLLGLLVALMAERFLGPAAMRTVRPSRERQEQSAPITPPVLAQISAAFGARACDYVVDWPMSPNARVIADLTARLLAHGVPGHCRIVTVTSPGAERSKTPLAVALARTAARSGSRVILIDGDLHHPVVAQAIGASSVVGLSGFLSGEAPLSRSLVKDPRSNALVLSSAHSSQDPAILASPKMAGFVAHLRGVCDLVVIDSPPVLTGGDTAFLTRLSDTVLVVVPGAAPSSAVASALRVLGAGAMRAGIVLTQ